MTQISMTALISAFSRGYHAKHNKIKVFDDWIANKILTDEEKEQITLHMCNGISFFNPAFNGTTEEALRWIVDNQLSPSPLGRAAWTEKALQTAVNIGTTQYFIFGAGYDTFAYRQPEWAASLQIFELDHPIMSIDKQKRIQKILENKPSNLTYIPIDLITEPFFEKICSYNTFNKTNQSFCSLLGIVYYLSKKDFRRLIHNIANSVPVGSTIVFDYPDEYTYTEKAKNRAIKQVKMAGRTTEAMLAGYSCKELEQLLFECGFLIYEHLTPDEITKQYFSDYNEANPLHPITAFDNVNYCLAVKK